MQPFYCVNVKLFLNKLYVNKKNLFNIAKVNFYQILFGNSLFQYNFVSVLDVHSQMTENFDSVN